MTRPTRGQPARPLLLNAIAGMLPLAVSLVLVPVQLRSLGTSGFGAWALVSASVGMVATLDLGLAASSFRYFGVNGEHGRAASDRLLTTALAVVGMLLVVLTPLLAMAAPLLASVLHQDAGQVPSTVALLRWLGPVITLPLAVTVLAARLQSAGRFGLLAVSVGCGQAVYAGGVLLAADRGMQPVDLAVALVAAQAVTGLVAAGAVVVVLGWRPWRCGLLGHGERRETASFAWRMQVAGLWGFVNLEADTLIVAALLPVSSVGAYAIGAGVAGGLRSGIATLLPPLLGPISAAGDDLGAALPGLVRVQRRWVRLATGPAVVAVPLAAGVAAVLSRGSGLAVVPVAAALAVGHAVNLGTGPLSYLTRAVGRPVLEARYGRFSALVNIGLTGCLTPWLGLVGVCVGTAVGQVAGSLWFVRVVRRALSLPVPAFVHDVPWPAAAVALVTMAAASAGVVASDRGTALSLVLLGAAAVGAWALSRAALRLQAARSVREPSRTSGIPQPS